MSDHRCIEDEYLFVLGKVRSLNAFISGPGFDRLDQGEKILLNKQSAHMEAYVEILSDRLKVIHQ